MGARNPTEYAELLLDEPLRVAYELGFKDLTPLNGEWISMFIESDRDETLQAHRLSYKTTCLSIAIAYFMILRPNKTILFMRKTDDDVVEIVTSVKKMLESDILKHIAFNIYGTELRLTKSNGNELQTNLSTIPQGTVQLLGMGTRSSLTGKHYDWIITDDIVTLEDRRSRAERERIKGIYRELQNVKAKNGRITNTGTPWHVDDCFELMPNIRRYDCYTTGIMTRDEIEEKRSGTTPSLFAANYELKHIASEGALFVTPPRFTSDTSVLNNGIAHIDAAYGGEDGNALTLGNRGKDKDGNDVIYLLGKRRTGHIDNCLSEFLLIKNQYLCGTVYAEENADKGYVKKEIRRNGDFASGYHESMNKYMKIATFLKKWWENIIFLEDTDPEYIREIMDYTEDAEHDDSPDSAASLIRKLSKDKTIYA